MGILSVKNISYSYEGAKKKVLNDISIDFEKCKIYSIIGKSGVGKTTLLSLISGLDVSSEGEIFYNDEALSKINRDDYRAKNIGVIFQGFNLLVNYTAIENIILSMEISGVIDVDKKEYAYALLSKVGINRETADRKILALSGGEQQRVAIARAIAHNPDIIIADEPTGNLDKDTETDILQILERLAHIENKLVIIVTHSNRVCSIADEIWGLKNGKLLFVK